MEVFYSYGSLKKCSQCGELIHIKKFGKDNRAPDGLKSACNWCLVDRRMEAYWKRETEDEEHIKLIEECIRKWRR